MNGAMNRLVAICQCLPMRLRGKHFAQNVVCGSAPNGLIIILFVDFVIMTGRKVDTMLTRSHESQQNYCILCQNNNYEVAMEMME